MRKRNFDAQPIAATMLYKGSVRDGIMEWEYMFNEVAELVAGYCATAGSSPPLIVTACSAGTQALFIQIFRFRSA